MKVKELIEKLKSFDQQMLVVTRGMDEEGFADINAVEVILIRERESEAARQALGEYKDAKNDDASALRAIMIDHG